MRLGCLLVLVVALAPVRTASAQDDWGLTRERGRPTERAPRRGPRRERARPGAERARAPEIAATDRSEVLVDRYLRALEAEPADGFALDRLIELHRARDGSVDALVARLEGRIASEDAPFAPRMILGHIQRRLGRLDQAIAHYDAAVALRPADALPRAALARVLLERGDSEGARVRLEEALSRSRPGPARDDVLRQLATLALERHDYDDARRRFDELASGASGSLFLRTELARALVERGEHDLAIAEYERLARTTRGDRRALAPVLVELGRAQLGAGRTDDAIATLDRALAAGGGASGVRAEANEVLLDAYRRADRLAELAERLGRRAVGADGAALLGRVHDELGHDDEALAAYRSALRSRPRDIDLRLRVIQVLGRAGRLDELALERRLLVRSAPGEPRYVIELAELLAQTGRRDEALAMIGDASRRSREPALHQRLAELYARWGEPERAAAELDLLVRLDPSDPVHLVALGSQRFEAGDRDAAMATWRRILTLGGDAAAAHVELGGILADHDLLEDAIAEYEQAVTLAPQSIDAVRGLAGVLERAGREDEAEERWRRVLALAGDDRAALREARERIVAIWARARALEPRIVELTRAFAAEPPDVEAGRMLAEAHRRGRDLGAAEAVLARLVELEPRDLDTLLSLERVRTQAGDLAGAIDTLRQLVEADPRRASGYLQRMAEHALALYRDEEALGYAREAVERNPDDATAHRRLGDLSRARQDLPGAIVSYRRALQLDDRLFDTAFELAAMHLARGEPGEADRIYRGVLERAPDDDLVARAARASMQIHVGAGTLEELERQLLPLALSHPERPVYRQLVVELYDAISAPLLVRARRAGAEGDVARADLRRYGARALKPLLEALADDHQPAQRRIALAILGPLGNPAAAPPLLGLAEDTRAELEVRTLAALAAAAIATPELAPRFAALASAPEPRLRAVAALALARLSGPAALEALRARLDDDDHLVRAWAALGLGRLRDRASAPRLRLLLGAPRPDVQAAAALALGWLGDRDSIAPLVTLAREGTGAPAEVALIALSAFTSDDARAVLVAALFDTEPAERRAAATALRRGMPSRDGLPLPLASESPAAWASRIVSDAGALPPPELDPLLPLVAVAFHDALVTGPTARTQAALGVLAGPPAPIGLGELTRDLDSWPDEARGRALAALERLAVSLREDLGTAFASPDAIVRAEAVRVLSRHDDARAAAQVAAALDDPAIAVRRAALDAFASGAPASPEASARASAMLATDRDWAMRTRAARALARIGGPGAAAPLAEALATDEFAFVREAAADALAAIGGDSARAALRTACESDAEARVRDAAARALGGSCEAAVR